MQRRIIHRRHDEPARHLLVHGYADIDRRVVDTLHNHLDDFERFRRALAASAAGPSG